MRNGERLAAKGYLGVDPMIGPIVHHSIKPGDQTNKILLVMRKRNLEVFVNSERVCEPVNFHFNLTPALFDLAAFDGPGRFRAEFEKVEIREFWDGQARAAPIAYSAIRSMTRHVYFDDFNDPGSRWTKGEISGYSNGLYFVIARSGYVIFKCPHHLRTDSALEVVGRLNSAESSLRGAWTVIVNRDIGTARRGFMVKLNAKGELFLTPTPDDAGKEFRTVDPTVGPIVHPAIKPGNRPNRLLLVIRKRSLEIFVNSQQVCEPVPYGFDLTPSFFQLGTRDGPGDFRAEFDSVAVREFTRP